MSKTDKPLLSYNSFDNHFQVLPHQIIISVFKMATAQCNYTVRVSYLMSWETRVEGLTS